MTFQAEHWSTHSLRDEPSVLVSDRALRAQVRQLTGLVGELTIALVIQGSYLNALRNRRARPTGGDLDEAIERVADSVPEAVAQELWAGRDTLLARLREGNEPA